MVISSVSAKKKNLLEKITKLIEELIKRNTLNKRTKIISTTEPRKTDKIDILIRKNHNC